MQDFVKLNSDGSSRGNPGPSGGGGIIKDADGKMLITYAKGFGDESNNKAEAMALLIWINWCSSNGIKNLEVESDSLFLINWITDKAKPPWNIRDTVQAIKITIESFDYLKPGVNIIWTDFKFPLLEEDI